MSRKRAAEDEAESGSVGTKSHDAIHNGMISSSKKSKGMFLIVFDPLEDPIRALTPETTSVGDTGSFAGFVAYCCILSS